MENSKNRFYTKSWFIVIMMFVFFPLGAVLMWYHDKFNMSTRILLTLIFGVIYMDFLIAETPKDEPVTQSTKEVKQLKPEIHKFQLGDTVEFKDMNLTLNSVRIDDGQGFLRTPENDVHLIADVTVENLSNEEQSAYSISNLALRDADGYEYTDTYFPDMKGKLRSDISPGDKLRGEIAFDVPYSEKYSLIYEKLWEKGQAIWEFEI